MIVESLARLRLVAHAFTESERPSFWPAATPASVERLEQAAGVRLPNDFYEFLFQADAVIAMDIQNGYWIGGTEGLALNIGRSDFPHNVEGMKVIPVATDGGGNAFLLAVAGDHVWQWDHETGHVKEVACSFVAFLSRVADDWEQFAAGNNNWDCLV